MASRRALIIFLWTAAVASARLPQQHAAAAHPAVEGGGGRGRGGRGGGGDAPVVTSKVGERDVPIELAAIGNVEAFVSNFRSVPGDRHARRSGSFHEGDVVKQGQLLCSRSIGGRSRRRSRRLRPI